MTERPGFRPNWNIHPGVNIADLLEEQDLTPKEAAHRLGFSSKLMSDLLKGRVAIQQDTAEALARVLGSTPDFWLRLQALYEAERDRLDREQQLAEAHSGWLKRFPLAEMIAWGWLPKAASTGARIDRLLDFFDVASPQAWDQTCAARLVAFRTSTAFENKLGATTAWLRQGERQALAAHLKPWNLAAFRDLLPTLRGLSLREDFDAAWAELTEACAAVGVAIVLVRPPKGCRASGATFFLGPDRAVLMLSGRHKSDDHLWFSFFHEASHLVLHSNDLLIIEGLNGLDQAREHEANRLAADLLIPPRYAWRLATLRAEIDVRAFAAEIGIAPGIVVGRLQHEGIIPRANLNGLKRKFTWGEAAQHGE